MAWHARAICLGCCERAIRGNCKHQCLSPMERGWGLILLLSVIAFFLGGVLFSVFIFRVIVTDPKIAVTSAQTCCRKACHERTTELMLNEDLQAKFKVPHPVPRTGSNRDRRQDQVCVRPINASRNEAHMHSASYKLHGHVSSEVQQTRLF